MTEGVASADPLTLRRRRARYRAWHRGTKEMDIIMGRFADAELDGMNAQELDLFEELIDVGDPELFSWIVKGGEVPDAYRTPLFQRLKAFHCG